MPDETTYYADKRVRVTNARAILDNKTYAMANITSVSLTSEEPNRLWMPRFGRHRVFDCWIHIVNQYG